MLLILLLVVCSFSRSSHQRCSVRKGVLRDFAKFTGKNLWQSLFFNKVAGWACNSFKNRPPATLLKKRLWHSSFPLNFAKFLKTPFLQNTSERLLLQYLIVLLNLLLLVLKIQKKHVFRMLLLVYCLGLKQLLCYKMSFSNNLKPYFVSDTYLKLLTL